MIPANFSRSPHADAVRIATGVREVSFSMPWFQNAPTYERRDESTGLFREERCGRVDWVTQDGRRMFAFIEPVLERRQRRVGAWPFTRTIDYDADDIDQTLRQIVRLIQSAETLGASDA